MHVDGSRCLWGRLAALVSWCSLSPVLLANGYTSQTANFTVVAPTAAMARDLGQAAERCRREVASEWLGKPLPTAPQRTTLRVAIEGETSRATTYVDPAGTNHRVTISAPDWRQVGPLVQHEVAHTVLLTALGSAIPDWANEGIASRYDGPLRHDIRQRKLHQFAALDSWPSLAEVFESPVEAQWSYAACVSVTDLLVERGGKRQFVAFLVTADRVGIESALAEHYGLGSIRELEKQWHERVRRSCHEVRIANSTERSTLTR